MYKCKNIKSKKFKLIIGKRNDKEVICDLCGFKSPFKSLFAEIVMNKCTIGYLCLDCSKSLIYKEETPYIKIIK